MVYSDSGLPRAEATFYLVRLGAGAAARGERVLCQWLRWADADERLAHVRIVRSTLPSYAVGRIGVVKSERLVPVRLGQPA
jgi:hypothetical protein